MHKINIALVGNPNCGKTAIFNALTGSRQKVGNWPGVTVDKKMGFYTHEQQTYKVTDLPGIYSLSMMDDGALDVKIACDYLLEHPMDVVVNVIDGSNLERNLYLTLQLLEMQVPVVLAVNMLDVVKQRGLSINLSKLSEQLACPVVGLTASKKQGLNALKAAVSRVKKQTTEQKPIALPDFIQEKQQQLQQMLASTTPAAAWMALRLLEEDQFAKQHVSKDVLDFAAQAIADIQEAYDEDVDILVADARYGRVNAVALAVVEIVKSKRYTLTQALDRVVLNRFIGIPIFLLVMYLMFLFAINIGGAFQDFFDIGSTTLLVDGMAHLLTSWHWPIWLVAIIANGIGKGINTTITFIPVIGGMFLFLSFLEDSGYMARAAFVVDRLMSAMGLPGKSFVPMIVGFGCNVPAVMGARTLMNRRDRVLAVMMMPFMSCGARLAIFAVFAAAFFPRGGQDVIFTLYLLGIVVAVLTGLLLRKSILPGKPAPLVMELPAYHVPQITALLKHTWFRLSKFLRRAGRVIVPVCLVIGVLNSVTVTGHLVKGDSGSQDSVLSAAGKFVTPVLTPMGVTSDNWPATVGLATGVLAKEVVVGTLNTLYSQVGHLTKQQAEQFNLMAGLKAAVMSIPDNLADLKSAWRNPIVADEAPHDMNHRVYGLMASYFHSKAAAFAYLLFVLLYFPCVSTMAVMRREVGNRWTYFSMGWSTFVAYGSAVICYQGATLTEHPLVAFSWIGAILLGFLAVIGWLRHYAAGRKRRIIPIASKGDR